MLDKDITRRKEAELVLEVATGSTGRKRYENQIKILGQWLTGDHPNKTVHDELHASALVQLRLKRSDDQETGWMISRTGEFPRDLANIYREKVAHNVKVESAAIIVLVSFVKLEMTMSLINPFLACAETPRYKMRNRGDMCYLTGV